MSPARLPTSQPIFLDSTTESILSQVITGDISRLLQPTLQTLMRFGSMCPPHPSSHVGSRCLCWVGLSPLSREHGIFIMDGPGLMGWLMSTYKKCILPRMFLMTPKPSSASPLTQTPCISWVVAKSTHSIFGLLSQPFESGFLLLSGIYVFNYLSGWVKYAIMFWNLGSSYRLPERRKQSSAAFTMSSSGKTWKKPWKEVFHSSV